MQLHNLTVSQGGRYYHVLQPNQYSGQKVLSDEESRSAYDENSAYRKEVEHGYPLLRNAGGQLREAGVSFLDGTDVFSGNSQTLYTDACCHFNTSGVEAFARKIVDFICSEQSNASASRPIALSQ